MSTPDPAFNAVKQEWDTPSEAEIPEITKQHVAAMETTDDPAVWRTAGMRHVLMTMKGRKSGNTHKVALPYWVDPSGRRVVVASFAGARKHPSWLHNIRDQAANPSLEMLEEGRRFEATVEVLEGSERDDLWAQLTNDRAWYQDYQDKTDRQIPLVRITETRDL